MEASKPSILGIQSLQYSRQSAKQHQKTDERLGTPSLNLHDFYNIFSIYVFPILLHCSLCGHFGSGDKFMAVSTMACPLCFSNGSRHSVIALLGSLWWSGNFFQAYLLLLQLHDSYASRAAVVTLSSFFLWTVLWSGHKLLPLQHPSNYFLTGQ